MSAFAINSTPSTPSTTVAGNITNLPNDATGHILNFLPPGEFLSAIKAGVRLGPEYIPDDVHQFAIDEMTRKTALLYKYRDCKKPIVKDIFLRVTNFIKKASLGGAVFSAIAVAVLVLAITASTTLFSIPAILMFAYAISWLVENHLEKPMKEKANNDYNNILQNHPNAVFTESDKMENVLYPWDNDYRRDSQAFMTKTLTITDNKITLFKGTVRMT
jgi:hypothetical protein